jgi:uncharacterized protein YqjF (DUF2071 family)
MMRQTWTDLLFAHWPLPADAVRALVPAPFDVDLFGGTAWVGVVPFRMSNVTARGVPPVPWLSAFPELNVRTYVSAGGKPGVYFFSLDAARLLAVIGARRGLGLPYYHASMRVSVVTGSVDYESRRIAARGAEFTARYRASGPPYLAAPGSLDYFLTERYCLYARKGHRPYRLEIDHQPWRLQPAVADIARNSMIDAAGLPTPPGPPLLHFAQLQDMVAWLPETLGSSGPYPLEEY